MANQILYGFHNLQDVKNRRVTEVGVDVINTAVTDAVARHNEIMDALLDFFVVRTTEFKTRFRSMTAGRLQPLDENGRARPRKTGGFYDVAFPLHTAGTAWGFNYITGQKMTVAEAQEATNALITDDRNWIIDHIYAALFAENDWTFTDDLQGTLTVKAIANGDAQIYMPFGGGLSGTTADHVLAQANAIGDANNPFPTIYTKLKEHPENAGQVVAFVPTNLVASIEGLEDYKEPPDANLRPGANDTVLVGNLPGNLPGTLRGYTNKVWIVEAQTLPSNYILATTTEGDRPIAMREDVEDSLRGFTYIADRNDHPWYERQYMRRAGFGAWNRLGAVVMRIGNGTYAVPSGYGSPMP